MYKRPVRPLRRHRVPKICERLASSFLNSQQDSTSRSGACADNAAMESFFSLLQNNVLDRKRWQTREQLHLAIITWIEKTWHRRRRQQALGHLTPVEYGTLPPPAAHAA